MCRTLVARVMTAATAGATYPQGSQASECLIVPYIPKFGSLSHPHGLEEAPVVHCSAESILTLKCRESIHFAQFATDTCVDTSF